MSLQLPSILIIDDNEDDRYLLRRMLRKLNITDRIFEVDNGQRALEFLTDLTGQQAAYPGQFPPQLVFLDINMPLMDGFLFLEQFRQLYRRNEYASVVVMMFTSSNLTWERERASEFEFVKGGITKMPPDAETLRAAIEAALSK
jgi:CheY-like chemotaxis protein